MKTSCSPVCFWCRLPKPMTVMQSIQSLRGEEFVMLDYDPCDRCLDTIYFEKYGTGSKGVWTIEVMKHPNVMPGQPPICEGQPLYPTGRWAVVEAPAASVMFYELGIPQEIVTASIGQRRMLMTQEQYQGLLDFGKPKGAQKFELDEWRDLNSKMV